MNNEETEVTKCTKKTWAGSRHSVFLLCVYVFECEAEKKREGACVFLHDQRDWIYCTCLTVPVYHYLIAHGSTSMGTA